MVVLTQQNGDVWYITKTTSLQAFVATMYGASMNVHTWSTTIVRMEHRRGPLVASKTTTQVIIHSNGDHNIYYDIGGWMVCRLCACCDIEPIIQAFTTHVTWITIRDSIFSHSTIPYTCGYSVKFILHDDAHLLNQWLFFL